MKLKSLLTAALMVCSTLTMSAEDFLHALKVERNDGTVDTYLFVDKPEVTFSKDDKGQFEKRCRICGKPLAWNAAYPVCDRCYRKMGRE